MGTYALLYRIFFALLAVVYWKSLHEPIQVPRQILLSLFLGATLVLSIKAIRKNQLPSDLSVFKNPIALACALLVLLTGVSFIPAIANYAAAYTLSRELMFLLFLSTTIFLLMNGALKRQDLLRAVTLFLLIAELLGLFQLLGGVKSISELSATFGNKNLYASAMLFSLPFALLNAREKGFWRGLSLLAVVIAPCLIFYLEARATLLALLVFTLIYCVAMFTKFKTLDPFPKATRIIAAMMALVIIGAGVTLATKPKLLENFTDTATLNERKALWSNTIQMIQDNPITGVGAGNWKFNNPNYGLYDFESKASRGLEKFQRPHNDFLWVFSERGALGIIVYIMLFVFALMQARKLMGEDSDDPVLYLVLFATICAYIVNALFDFPSERIEHQLILMSVLALLVVGNRKGETKNRKAPVLMTASLPIALCAIIFSLLVCHGRYQGEYHTLKMIDAKNRANWPLVVNEVDNAMNAFYRVDASATPMLWYKGLGYYAQGNTKEALNIFDQAHSDAPYDIHVLTNIAACQAALGDQENAIEYFRQATRIAPDYVKPRLNLAMIHQQRGEKKEAYEIIAPLPYAEKNKNYMDVVPSVLKQYSDEYLAAMQDQDLAQRILSRIDTPRKMVDEYALSKKQNLEFMEYLKLSDIQ